MTVPKSFENDVADDPKYSVRILDIRRSITVRTMHQNDLPSVEVLRWDSPQRLKDPSSSEFFPEGRAGVCRRGLESLEIPMNHAKLSCRDRIAKSGVFL